MLIAALASWLVVIIVIPVTYVVLGSFYTCVFIHRRLRAWLNH